MAPSNLNQVFVINDPAMYDTTTFANTAAVTASKLGVWDVDNSTYDDDAALTTKKRIQFVQTMPSGNPIASPIIDVANIVRINYKEWTDVIPTRATQTIDFGTPTSTKNVMLRIALRTAPTNYANFYPNGAALDLSGNGYEFPLVGNFAAGRMIFNIEIASGTHGGSETALVTAMYNAVLANKTLNALFAATDSGTSGLVLTARHYGVEFDVTSQYSDNTGAVGTVTASRTNASSNYVQALSDERSQRSRYGNFNRMYFPVAFPEFAQSGYKYDVIEVYYKHDWPASTGIARAGELNVIKIYVGASSTALAYAAEATGTDFATVFNYTGGTSSEQLF